MEQQSDIPQNRSASPSRGRGWKEPGGYLQHICNLCGCNKDGPPPNDVPLQTLSQPYSPARLMGPNAEVSTIDQQQLATDNVYSRETTYHRSSNDPDLRLSQPVDQTILPDSEIAIEGLESLSHEQRQELFSAVFIRIDQVATKLSELSKDPSSAGQRIYDSVHAINARNTTNSSRERQNLYDAFTNYASELEQEYEQIVNEIIQKLPPLVEKAQENLTKLNQGENWKEKSAALLDQQRQADFIQSIKNVYKCVESYSVITGKRAMGNDMLPKLHAELEYNNTNLSAIINTLDRSSDRNDLSFRDRQREGDRPEQTSTSDHNPERRWQGSARQALESLAREAFRLDIHRYNTIEDLEDALNDIYGDNFHQEGFTPLSITDEEYKNTLDRIPLPEEIEAHKQVDEDGHGFLHFLHPYDLEEGEDDATVQESKRRIALNIHPDRILDTTKDIVQKIAILPYVYDVKVTYSKEETTLQLDNTIIYFRDSADSTNRDNLEQYLLRYAEDTRPYHPAMMEPIRDAYGKIINGMAFADQSKVPEGSGWGKTRVKPIAEVLWKLKEENKQIPFREFLLEVEEQFRAHNIIPAAPQWFA